MQNTDAATPTPAGSGALKISVTAAPSAEDLARIGEELSRFNEQDVGPAERLPLAVLVHDERGTLVGGISGYTAWGWVYVQWLWLEAGQRGKGLAAKLLAAAESEGQARGCHGSYIDTFNPVALKTYTRAGYVPFGELKDFPKGRTRTFLSKAL
jgi:GNAT superfamily N-acetyltransferase